MITVNPESHASSRPAVAYAPITSPIGRLYLASHETLIVAVGRSAGAIESSVCARFGHRPERHATLPPPLAHAVAAHLDHGVESALRFDVRGLPEFDQAVLRAVQAIPRGEVRSYAWVARQVGEPHAAMQVGIALHDNPIPVLIPCHRVVHSDGRLGGYVFGTHAKRALLRAEGVTLPLPGRAA